MPENDDFEDEKVSEFKEATWSDVEVGDIVIIKAKEAIFEGFEITKNPPVERFVHSLSLNFDYAKISEKHDDKRQDWIRTEDYDIIEIR